jgi:hypothetical protein
VRFSIDGPQVTGADHGDRGNALKSSTSVTANAGLAYHFGSKLIALPGQQCPFLVGLAHFCPLRARAKDGLTFAANIIRMFFIVRGHFA